MEYRDEMLSEKKNSLNFGDLEFGTNITLTLVKTSWQIDHGWNVWKGSSDEQAVKSPKTKEVLGSFF